MMQPLDDVRVLDMSRLLPGPFATHVLTELGAHVDKLEDTGAGDYLRHMPPMWPGTEMGAMYTLLNGNKRSAALDLKSEAGRATFRELLPHYDVLFDQFRPGVLARLGLGHDALLAAHPRLVVCALTGYGQSGPLRDRAGHDLNYLARGGVLGFQGPAHAPPAVPGAQMADIGGALYAVIAILAALRERDRSGHGSVIDVSMLHAAMSFAVSGFASVVAGAAVTRAEEPLAGGLSVYGTYATKDGRYVAFGALEPKFWAAFSALVGLAFDATALMPGAHQSEWKEKLAAIFRTRTRDEWTALGEANAICVEPVLSPEEALADGATRARALTQDGRAWSLPFAFSGAFSVVFPESAHASTETGQRRHAPLRGEHTREILDEVRKRTSQ